MQKRGYVEVIAAPYGSLVTEHCGFMSRTSAICDRYRFDSSTHSSSSDDNHIESSMLSKLLNKIRKSPGVIGAFYKTLSRLYWRLKIWRTRGRSDIDHVCVEFKNGMGYPLNLEHPVSFSEKLQYLKLYDQTALHQICADKIKVRDYVSRILSDEVLVPMIMATYDVDEITPERILADRFVIKTNHDSGSIQFCHDRDRFDWEQCRRTLKRSLDTDFWLIGRELQYRDIRRGIIVEAMLHEEGHNLRDYKFYCFGGEPIFLQVDIDRFNEHRRDFFDTDWNKLNVRYHLNNSNKKISKPATLGTMLDYARTLSKPFKFARIDLYSIGTKVYFGEITFHPYSGFKGFTPASFDRDLGDLIDI